MIAGPLGPRRWLIFDIGDDEDFLTGDRPIAELSAGAQPWESPAGGWRTRDCLGGLRETDAELRAVRSRRQWDDCSTLTWRLTGLGEHHPRLALLAGQFQVTNEYSSGAPVYRAADTSAVLQRVVSGSRSSWVLHSPRDNETQMAALGEYTDRINLIRTERFVASGLPGQDFLDQPVFVCHPEEWERGDADFTLPDLDGYKMTLTASDPDGPSSRLAVTQILVFNETCDQLQGRTSACDEDTCFNGGTCASVTLKHHLCLCPPGFLGPRCEDRVDCGEPDAIAFGQATRISGNAYLDRAYYACSPGYAPSETVLGVSWSVCHHNGSWVNTPRCEPLAGQAYIECDFATECADFNTRLDNEYNTDTDQEWERSERLRTSDIRPQGVFLTTYRARGQRTLTSRLRTPCLDLQASGCLQLDAYLSNATLTVMDWRTNRVLFRTEEGGRRLLVPLHPQAGPLLVVVQLEPGESEACAGLDPRVPVHL
ncbi:Sushi, nidogen and EGF-like domain-containing protein 1 [Amphibalanus amphitrite]|uniref:Sushi, nidogen and EGF-like domain-containing protein 1 n=1 Tax=Amphibalanus amphitrite TaxID=1232801 RepID=A0A6A4X424_AMPAM|nr:Sushi, nidogen and EGF-like domain-containing protein 1 [Amphibalanus amphitrite]